MKRILVTGSNGFTGQYVCRAFRERDYKVHGLVHSNPGPDESVCDLRDRAAVARFVQELRPDGVVHLAAQSFVGHSDEREFYDINLFGTLNLLDALESSGNPVSRVVIASSANVYGPVAEQHIAETAVPNPVNQYAMSKLAMEYMVKVRWDRLPVLITRPFNYTGPGQQERFLIPKIVNYFRRKEPVIELGNLDVARDFSDVRDIARAYLALYESDVRSEVVNLCSGKVSGLAEIIAMMNDIAGYEIDVRVNADYVRENEIPVLGGDNNKFRELTGLSPEFSLPDTLRAMLHVPNGGSVGDP